MSQIAKNFVKFIPCDEYDKFYFICPWQVPPIGQEEHLQPQEDFPFFVFLTMVIMMDPVTAMTISKVTMVPRFSIIHVIQ